MTPTMHRLALRLLPALLIAAIALPPAAVASDASDQATLAAQAAKMKQMQLRFMRRGALAEMGKTEKPRGGKRAKSALAPKPWSPPVRERDARETRRGDRDRREREGLDADGEGRRPNLEAEPPDPAGVVAAPTARLARPASVRAIATNHIANNRSTDNALCPSAPCTGLPWSGQCEVSIGAFGNNLVAAWNDGEGFDDGVSTQGYAYSTNNGTAWTDGGVPPLPAGMTEWTSDPVIAVNEKTGSFYYAALVDNGFAPTDLNGIAVIKGTFSGASFSWGTPRLVVSGQNQSVVYDKEWIAADSLTGNLYVTYTKFAASDEIQLARNTTDNAGAWTAPIKLSSAADDGAVQGSRVAIGPAGEVWTVWNAIGSTDLDFMRVRKAAAGGTIFGGEVTAASLYTNFGTGGPGFNRGTGYSFPSIAIDRSNGAHRGRAYLAWNESINFYNDNFSARTPGNQVNESEPNDSPATADAFTFGKNLVGTISSVNDLDYWSFTGTAGQTIICELDTVYTTTLDASFRLFCSDGTTRLAYSESGFGGFDISSALIVFTLPANGTYTLRVASTTDSPTTPPGTGGYRILTVLNGAVTERARDHRDVFVTTSDNGTAWTTPVRVNGEAAHFDDWLPEVAVAGNGNAYVQWYDWRDAPAAVCAGASMTYLSRSTDGGVTWPDGSPVSSSLSFWTTAYSNIIPNEGDYSSLFANQNAVYSCWSDGRNNDPDVFMATVNLAFTPVQVALVSAEAQPDLVRLTWYAPAGDGLLATVYRRTASGEWSALADVSPDGSGQIVYEDHAVTAGARYVYRLGLHETTGETFTDEVTVDVPVQLTFAVQNAGANPTSGNIRIAYSIPDAGEASLELLDVAGRRVDERTVHGPGASQIDLAPGRTLAPGVYLVRLTHAGRSVTTRVSVLR